MYAVHYWQGLSSPRVVTFDDIHLYDRFVFRAKQLMGDGYMIVKQISRAEALKVLEIPRLPTVPESGYTSHRHITKADFD